MADISQHIDPVMLDNLQRIGGQKLCREMLSIFLEQLPQKMEAVQAALDNKDAYRLEHAAHSIKSSAGNLGAVQLREIASGMEESAEREDLDVPTQLWKDLQTEYAIVEKIYKAKLKELS